MTDDAWVLSRVTGHLIYTIEPDPTLAVYTHDGLAIEAVCAEAMRTRHLGSIRPQFAAPPTPLGVKAVLPDGERQAGTGHDAGVAVPAKPRWLRTARLARARRNART